VTLWTSHLVITVVGSFEGPALWERILFESARMRLAALPKKAWDGFRAGLYVTGAWRATLSALPLIWLAGRAYDIAGTVFLLGLSGAGIAPV
jgi:hypothetical protein